MSVEGFGSECVGVGVGIDAGVQVEMHGRECVIGHCICYVSSSHGLKAWYGVRA